MGDLFGGKTETKTTESGSTSVSDFQKPYLDQLFGGAKDMFGSKSGTPYYQGDTYAGLDENAKATLERLKAFAGGTGLDASGSLSKMGQTLSGSADKAVDAMDRFTAMAGEDPLQANIAAAGKYAANPFVGGMIDANSRDVVRNLTEQQLPGIDRAASGTGNLNSSRAGVAAGIARRGAEDRIGDISATLRGQAYDRGLTLAQNDRSTNLDALSTAANGYGSLASAGADALTAGAQAGYGAFGQMVGADAALKDDRQGQLDADFDKWKGEDTREYDLLKRYAELVASSQWGSKSEGSSSSVQKSNPGLGASLLGAATTGLGIAGGMGWQPFK